MYEGYVIKEHENDTAEILRALGLRHVCLGSGTISQEAATEQHMGFVYDDSISYDMDVDDYGNMTETQDMSGAKAAVQKERELLAEGNRYFEMGYRLRRTYRQMNGISIDVPDEAIAWVNVSAGHIATAEAHRIEYLVLPISQSVTPAEIEASFKLGKGTVRQYLNRHADEMLAKGEIRRPTPQTWLVLLSVAKRIWGKQEIFIILPNDMLWQDASEDDYNQQATEDNFIAKLSASLVDSGYNPKISFQFRGLSLIEDNDGTITDNRYDEIRGIMDSIEADYIEKQENQ